MVLNLIGPYDPKSSVLAGRVFTDDNADNTESNGTGGFEAGIAGLSVRLLNSSGQLIKTTTTDALGNYAFTQLAEGTYFVQFPTSVGDLSLVEKDIGNFSEDSDADQTTGKTVAIHVPKATTVNNIDAGYRDLTPPDGIVSGTSGNDLIDINYIGDPDGDQIDNNDAILPGQSGDMDVVDAGAGNDTVVAGEGNDTVFAGDGDDSVFGGDGDDLILGDTGLSNTTFAAPLSLQAQNVVAGSQTGHDGAAVVGNSVFYNNVSVTEDGRAVMAKLVLVDASPSLAIDLTGGAGSEILLNGNNDRSDGGKTASFRLEFYDQITGQPVAISSVATFGDLDRTATPEGVTIPSEQFFTFGTSSNTSLDVTSNGGTVSAFGTEENDPSDQDAWFSAAFENRASIEFTLTTRDQNSGFTLNGSVIDQPFVTLLDAPGNDVLDGGEGNDTIFGEAGNDTLLGQAGNDKLVGGVGDDEIDGGAGNDTIYGDDLRAGAPVTGTPPGEIQIGNIAGANYTLLVWDLQQVSVTNAAGNKNPFPDDASGEDDVVGSTFTLSETGIPKAVGIKDGDNRFDDGPGFQDLSLPIVLNGNSGKAGDRLTPEYSYSVQDSAGQIINIYAVELDGNDAVGFVSDKPMVQGETYTFLGRTDTYPEVKYSQLATSYFTQGTSGNDQDGPEDAVAAGNDLIYGGTGDDLVFGQGGNDIIFGGSGNDTIYGDEPVDGLPGDTGTPDTGEVAIDAVAGAKYTLLVWDLQQVSVDNASGNKNPFPNDTTGEKYVVGSTFTLSETGIPTAVGIKDSFNWFDDGDGTQDLSQQVVLNGISGNAGDRLTPEYSYSVQGSAGQVINIYVVELDGNKAVGFVSDKPMVQGETYTFLGRTDTHPEVKYSQLATSYFTADGTGGNTGGGTPPAIGDDLLFGGDGNDTVFGGAGNDTVSGEDGADSLFGGDGRDLFVGGTAGDVVDGGSGGDDVDTLDLSGSGPLRIINQTVDPDGNSISGTVEFLDNAGNVTGAMTFSEIEQLILPENSPPEAQDDTISTDEDTPVTIDVLANDSDPDSDPLTITEATVPADQGTVTIVDNQLVFTPAQDVNGPVEISYTVTDGNGGTDTATVTVDVTPVNDDPVAQDDTASTGFNTPVTVDVLANDTDVDGDPLTLLDATVPADQGTVAIVDNQIVFTPATGFSGPAEISYTVDDGAGGTDTGTLAVEVTAPNFIVEGTPEGDLIDVDYLGDPEGDRVDAGDNEEGDDDDMIIAGDGSDTVFAGLGDDTVFGGSGQDEIFGGPGNDELDGGSGSDTLFGGDGDDTINGGSGNDSISAGDGENHINGGVGEDTINGGDDNDTIFGGGDNDSIRAGAGDDVVHGDDGNDTIFGFEGSDQVYGGDGNDVINTRTSEGTGVPDQGLNYPDDPSTPFNEALLSYPSDTDSENDRDLVFGGSGNDTILTGDDQDTIFGDSGSDSIDAGFDDDFVYGGADDDTIEGGEGADTVYGEAGDDVIYGGLSPDVIGGIGSAIYDLEDEGINTPVDPNTGNNTDLLFGGDGNDRIFGQDDADQLHGGTGNDTLDGGIDDDLLFGDEGDDLLIGGQGNDTLDGGEGVDTLTGGTGPDVFIADGTADLITDFNTTEGIGNDVQTDNDFVDLSAFYNDTTLAAWNAANPTQQYSTPLQWLRAEQTTGVLMSAGGLLIQNAGVAVAAAALSQENTSVVCFVAGTLITTKQGDVPIETLQVGDMVVTKDHGYQPVRWIGSTKVQATGRLAPIRFRKGALANDRDLLVSPQHRMLLSGWQADLLFGVNEVLVAAKHLVNDGSITRVEGGEVEYFHMMFDEHEIVYAEGCQSESFHPGHEGWGALAEETRAEIIALFPQLATEAFRAYGFGARRTLKQSEAKMAVEAGCFIDQA